MMTTDPIADMLTRIRNALTARHDSVEMPSSKMKKSIADILLAEGYIKGVEVKEGDVQPTLVLQLKYGANKQKAITGIKRISKPGLRVYVPTEKLPKVLGGLGIAIVSTSKGVMTDKQARAAHAGGEVLAYVW
ncbi:MAG: 30S ribosomal protein S8 [Clostridia bacterium]|nr:30S ribosomal protein S8 [Clostridia bacterium]